MLLFRNQDQFPLLNTILGVWLGQFVCGLFTNGDLWCIGHPDEAGGRGTDP